LVSHELELFYLDVGLKNIGNFGIEEQSDGIFLEGQLYVVVVGAVDYKGKVYFNGFYIFIAIGYDDGECLFMEFLKRGGKVHL
jgi:hypothetical protein